MEALFIFSSFPKAHLTEWNAYTRMGVTGRPKQSELKDSKFQGFQDTPGSLDSHVSPI